MDVFVNLLHEGLSFLCTLSHDLLLWNNYNEVAKFSSKEPQVLTIIYLHIVRDVFEQYKRACVADENILQAFGLDPSIDYNSVWDVSTPEIASGESVKLVQIAVVQDNLFGNHKCSGRRNVSFSRAQMFMSTHMISECFKGDEVPDTWKAHFKVLRTSGFGFSPSEVPCDRRAVGCATAHE